MELQKAYDWKGLSLALKDLGLDATEEQCVKLLDLSLEFLEKSAALSQTPFDDVAVAVLRSTRSQLLPLIDKIDGKVG